MSEAVYDGYIANIECDVANNDLTETEVYAIAQKLLTNTCCLCGNKDQLTHLSDGQLCLGCIEGITQDYMTGDLKSKINEEVHVHLRMNEGEFTGILKREWYPTNLDGRI